MVQTAHLSEWQSVLHRPKGARMLIMAHRGASDDAPENTMRAFALSLEQGADVIETDLRFTRDDEIVLIHDATIDRTMDGSGNVSAMTLAEIKKLRARQPLRLTPFAPSPLSLSEGRGVRGLGEWGEEVPTLAEPLEFTDHPLALELKDARFANRADAARLIEILAKHDAIERCAIISFHLRLLQSIKSLAPKIPIGMITLSNPLPLYPTEFLGPLFPLLFLNPFYVSWARRLGKIVCPLDPAPEPRIGFYRWLGVPILLTNHPARTLRALKQ